MKIKLSNPPVDNTGDELPYYNIFNKTLQFSHFIYKQFNKFIFLTEKNKYNLLDNEELMRKQMFTI